MKKLPRSAYVPDPDQPFVPLTFGLQLPEFTWKAAISGIVLGMLFGAANTYLGLKAGLTIASLLGSSLVFYLFGWTDALGKATALMVGLVVCVAASIAGDTSQDLKTGFILGATPRKQQIGELLGVLSSAGVVAVLPRSASLDRVAFWRRVVLVPWPRMNWGFSMRLRLPRRQQILSLQYEVHGKR